ncbi:ABC transporter ATP-binding protein [Roseomonas chloroacetimidivorans]|jgi:capsular polysaccharide transport system ATP-binding protein|uniref:ABC transporter ATP-binding protein n=1 Tax=Roseomonas chloroacetimidivorans TaxID=1766656 RepID=UPI003C740DC1
MIELHRVTKSHRSPYGRQKVLDEISAIFDCTTDVGILGGNGSGKSTLLRIIAGMDKPDTGYVRRHVRVSFPISYGGGFHPNLSAHENVRFMARLYGADEAGVARFVRDFSEIGSHFDRPITTYSNSMKARVAFALSMAIEFDVYLVDEVTAVGDVAFKRKCIQALTERRKTAKLIMVSQAVTTIGRICEQGAILEDGRLHVYGSMADAIQAYENNLMVMHV